MEYRDIEYRDINGNLVIRAKDFGCVERHSLVLLKEPWVIIPISHIVWNREPILPCSITIYGKNKVINVGERESVVRAWLKRRDISRLMWDFCDIKSSSTWGEFPREELPVEPYFCFLGAAYIAHLFINEERDYPNLLNIGQGSPSIRMNSMIPQQFPLLDGIWYFSLYHSREGHSFVISFSDTKLTIYNTYGGYVGIFITEFDRKEWTSSFLSFFDKEFKEQIEIYQRLWGFSKNMTSWLRKYEHSFQSLEGMRLL